MMENHYGGVHKPIRIVKFISGIKSEYCEYIDKLKVIKKDIEELNNKNKPSASDEINNNKNVFYFIIFNKFIIIIIL